MSGDALGGAPALTRDQVRELMNSLESSAPALAALGVAQVVHTLGAVGERLADAGDPLHQRALEQLVQQAEAPPEAARWLLDGMARDWTTRALQTLLEREFGDPTVLDRFMAAPSTDFPDRRRRALVVGRFGGVGVHISSGSVPGVSVTSMLRGLLVKSPVLLKPGRADVVLPRLFAAGLTEAAEHSTVARALADALAVLWWPGGQAPEIEGPVLEQAGYVVVYGDDETTRSVRSRVPGGTPVVDYPHRVSVAVVDAQPNLDDARDLADAVAAFDQRGCVSVQQCFVLGDAEEAQGWAAMVARQLARLDVERPPEPATAAEASVVQQLRGTFELREAAGEAVGIWSGPGTRWTVVLDTADGPPFSCHSRTLRVVPLSSIAALRSALIGYRGRLQAVGLSRHATSDLEHAATLAETLAEAGAGRIVPLTRMPFPGPGWLHDGGGGVLRLVRWSEVEGP